jgi:hypothetical protein
MIRIKLIALVIFVLLCVAVSYGGRYITYRQTDPDDIVTRDRIDRQIDALFERFDRQIQADTVLLVVGTSQVIYLNRKYPDLDYQIFVSYRNLRDEPTILLVTPTTDSSFTLVKSNDDENTIQYMTIHKGN